MKHLDPKEEKLSAPTWTDARQEQLAALADEGLGPPAIARIMGLTGEQVRKRAQRTGVALVDGRDRTQVRSVFRAVAVKEGPEEISPHAVGVLDAGHRCCRWPLWKAGATLDAMRFCGAPKAGLAYCAAHEARSVARSAA